MVKLLYFEEELVSDEMIKRKSALITHHSTSPLPFNRYYITAVPLLFVEPYLVTSNLISIFLQGGGALAVLKIQVLQGHIMTRFLGD